jgi:hypothetical protein
VIGPTGQPIVSENGWPVGPMQALRRLVPQGVALGWENGRAFGPLNLERAKHNQHVIIHYFSK